MPFTPEGWTLLKTWEGCRLSAYPDPASGGASWTVGYGHTVPDLQPGLPISQAQAEAWLEHDAAKAAVAVDRLLSDNTLTPHQRDALISWCFNVGAGALERSTLRKGLLAGESPSGVIAHELPRWHKGPSAAGLLRCPMHKRERLRFHWTKRKPLLRYPATCPFSFWTRCVTTRGCRINKRRVCS